MSKSLIVAAAGALLGLPAGAWADPGLPPAAPRALFAQAAPAPVPAAAVYAAERPWLAALEPLVTETLQRNPEIQAARREREAAGHRVAPAGAFDDPMLEAGFINVPLPSLSFGKEDMTMKMIGLGQRLPFWGKRGLRQDVAARDAEAVGYGYEETVNRVLRELFVSWYDLALAAQSEQLIERNRGVLAQLVKSAEARYGVGQGAQAEVLRAQTQLTRMLEELLRMQRERVMAEGEVGRVLVRRGAPLGQQAQLPPPGAAPAPLDQLRERAFAQRPQLRALRSLVTKNERAIELAQKDGLPDFDVKLAYGARNPDPLGMKRDDMVTLTVAMNLPVWRETKVDPRIAEARAMREQAQAMLDAQQDEIRMRLHHQSATATQLARSVTLYDREILPQARITLESTLSAYQVGRVEFMTLLDSQMAVFNYEMARLTALAGYHKAQVEIDFLTGRLAAGALGLDPGKGNAQ